MQRSLRAALQPPRRRDSSDGPNGSGGDPGPPEGGGYLNAVAFVADGSMLPRKSGRSPLPMPSPPAVPFRSPESDQLTRTVTVDVGGWRRYLNGDGTVRRSDKAEIGDAASNGELGKRKSAPDGPSCNGQNNTADGNDDDTTATTTVTIRGMIIPCGVTLIVGGGYHGKSTMLQSISTGVYDSIPGDGRERVVSHADAVSVRAEDGRYADSVNVSAFLSDLPSGRSVNGASVADADRDTTRFSTGDALGSTSQAANVIESIESGASALLVDEDVSAANFMARDGRMRAMIMDEPITPFLYRVNGLYLSKRHSISTVVVVGGVGEWLDVADAVVLMRDYRAGDGLAKARSVSYQFSYGHVQYGGRGVVHRLPWEVKEDKKRVSDGDGVEAMEEDDDGEEEDEKQEATLSPLRRRPDPACVSGKFANAVIRLAEGASDRLWLRPDDDEEDVDCESGTTDADLDEDDGMVDMGKCGQLISGDRCSEQLYGAGLCALWVLRASSGHPDECLSELLDRMDRALEGEGGMRGILRSLSAGGNNGGEDHVGDDGVPPPSSVGDLLGASRGRAAAPLVDLLESVGRACRPRRHEVAMALARTRGMVFDILPPRRGHAEDDEEAERRREEEAKRRALADLWANRRRK